eukprot:10733052-Ditylum_brightwellii.AAC.1
MQTRKWALCGSCQQYGCGGCCGYGGWLKNGACGCFGFLATASSKCVRYGAKKSVADMLNNHTRERKSLAWKSLISAFVM